MRFKRPPVSDPFKNIWLLSWTFTKMNFISSSLLSSSTAISSSVSLTLACCWLGYCSVQLNKLPSRCWLSVFLSKRSCSVSFSPHTGRVRRKGLVWVQVRIGGGFTSFLSDTLFTERTIRSVCPWHRDLFWLPSVFSLGNRNQWMKHTLYS